MLKKGRGVRLLMWLSLLLVLIAVLVVVMGVT